MEKYSKPRFRESLYENSIQLQGYARHIRPRFDNAFATRASPMKENVSLVTNAYTLEQTRSKISIYEYKINLALAQGNNLIPSTILERSFVLRSIRRLISYKLVPQLTTAPPSQTCIVMDSKLTTMFSLIRLHEETNEQDLQEFKFEGQLVQTNLVRSFFVDIIIKYARTFSLISQDFDLNLRESILHHRLQMNMLRFGSVYYKDLSSHQFHNNQDGRLDLISNHSIGIAISGIRHCANDQTLFVINRPNFYITGSYRIIDLLASFIEGKLVPNIDLVHSLSVPEADLRKNPAILSITGQEVWFLEFCKILEGYKCVFDNKIEQISVRFCLLNKPASKLSLDGIDAIETTKKSITVQEQFKQIGINLNYPNLPCLKTLSTQFPYSPLEMCTLIPGQKVPNFRLGTKARNHLSKMNKPKPFESKKLASDGRDKISQMNESLFRSYSLELSDRPLTATGSNLERPILQYLNTRYQPNSDYWESGIFCQAIQLDRDWCIVKTVDIDTDLVRRFFSEMNNHCRRFGLTLNRPFVIHKSKEELLDHRNSFELLISESRNLTNNQLRLLVFVIDSDSTNLNRLIHLTFDDNPFISAACLRSESIMNQRNHRSIFRTLGHKLNARLGGTNVTYHGETLANLNLSGKDLMIIGLDVTHPDNELSGVSIIGCAYTYSNDLFKHKSIVSPQTARVEIIDKMDSLLSRLLYEYHEENQGLLPKHLIIYRDGVSHEEFEKVRDVEISAAQRALTQVSVKTSQPKPNISYIIAQKRHTMRFYRVLSNNNVCNPPSGTLIDQGIVAQNASEFYLYSNTNPQATARPIHYHVLLDGIGLERLKKLTYFLCFNFGRCSGSLSMPSSLRYAHNAAYDARNRVIAAREFSETKFYTSKFFC